MDNDKLRAEFERQHAGRNLLRHRLRGTYSSPPIAALWNQHVRSVKFGAEEERTLSYEREKEIVRLACLAAADQAREHQKEIEAIRNRERKE